MGDGNEGCFPRYFVTLKDNDNPWQALRALVANQYIAGKPVRRWIINNTEIDGDADDTIHATVYEGPNHESAFGAAWLCAELQHADWTDKPYDGWSAGCWHSTNDGLQVYPLRAILDNAALRQYRAAMRKVRT